MATTRSTGRPARPASRRPRAQPPADPAGAAADVVAPGSDPTGRPDDVVIDLTMFERPRAQVAPTDAVDAIDDLRGAVPTWRMGEDEPIYLEVIRDLGVPSLLDTAAPAGQVIRGEVVVDH